MAKQEPNCSEEIRDALAALVFAIQRPLSDQQREAFANDLWSLAQSAEDGGQPKSAELMRWMVRSAQFARKRLSAH